MAFLRAPNGAHLGPVSQFSAVQRGAGHPELFSAHPGSDRFAYARQLTVPWRLGVVTGISLEWGLMGMLRDAVFFLTLLIVELIVDAFRIAVATLFLRASAIWVA